MRSTGMNNQSKDDHPKDAALYALGATSITVLIAYVVIGWWV
jgi:hypothetical protein